MYTEIFSKGQRHLMGNVNLEDQEEDGRITLS
jgi:hypothetical protein